MASISLHHRGLVLYAASRADIYQRITDRIAAAIEAGAGEWRTP